MNIKEIFYELIIEAKNGKIFISDEEFYIGFNTNINDEFVEYSKDNTVELYIDN